jgi:NADPH-dependent ferric siderophore reductase
VTAASPEAGGRGGSGRPRPPRRQVEVRSVRRLTPRMVRIRVGGPDLAGFADGYAPGAHMKLFVPDGDGGTAMRTYTPRNVDADGLELDVDVVLHGSGPAARWAEEARPGDRVALAGPKGGFAVEEGADWLLVAGDDSALPAIGDLLSAVPAGLPTTVLLEVADPEERQPLAAGQDVDVYWLFRSDGDDLVDAVRRLPQQQGSGQAWVGCEAAAMRAIRRHLMDSGTVPRARLATRGYWRQGEAGYPDHDFGEDVQ